MPGRHISDSKELEKAMVATLLLLFAVVHASPNYAIPTQPTTSALPLTAIQAPAVAPSDEDEYHVFLPIVRGQASGCAPISGVQYTTLSVAPPPTDRPAEQHADLNLALRGFRLPNAYRGLVDYAGEDDPAAPQLYTLFATPRVPAFTAVYQVYDWDWDCNCRAGLLTYPPVTLAGMGVTPGEVLRLPDSGYNIGDGYEALVLYASEERITLKYTREDNVVRGYTIHVENVCVEPTLLALYRTWNSAGRGRLPALRAGQAFGRARGGEIGVAICDTGAFMDPRARQSWWQPR
jgi:hypothetical protein